MEYMSQEGYDKLVAELQEMINVELPRVKDAIAEARDKGDLSENFEYHAAKREQGKLLSRISYKQKILENARVIDASVLGNDTVGLLRKVEMTNLGNNAKMTYTIVNPHEANLREGKISIKSPIAEALLGKKTGEIVEAKVPSGILKLRIDNITL
jgi:transcription elongation factor GreA